MPDKFKIGDTVKILNFYPIQLSDLQKNNFPVGDILLMTFEIDGVFHLEGRDRNPSYSLSGFSRYTDFDGFYEDQLSLVLK